MTDPSTLRALGIAAAALLMVAGFALVFGLKWLEYRKVALRSGEAEREALAAFDSALRAQHEKYANFTSTIEARCNATDELYRKSFQKLSDEGRATFQQLKDHYQAGRPRKAG